MYDTLLSIGIWLAVGAGLALLVDSYTKGMYVPKHWHQVFPAISFFIGLHIWEKFKNDIGAFLVMLAFIGEGLMHGWYLMKAGIYYQGYNTAINTPDPKPAPVVQAEPMLPKVNLYKKPIPQFENVVEMPRFDIERRFSIDVLRMFDFDPDTQKHVDLTEERWVNQKKMFAQKPFANMKLKWEHFGLLKRKSAAKNAKFLVGRREAVALVASGNPLPDWDPPAPSK